MKFVFGALVLASVISLICISLIPRNLTRDQVAAELDRMLEGENVVEKNVLEADWMSAENAVPDAFGATVSRPDGKIRIYFDRMKIRFQKHPVPDTAPAPTTQ